MPLLEYSREDLRKLVDNLRFGLGAEVLIALVNQGLPRMCWAGHSGPDNDNLLMHILARVDRRNWMVGDRPKAALCLFLATNYTIEELSHRNVHGTTALWYVEDYYEMAAHPEASVFAVRGCIFPRCAGQRFDC